MYFDKNTKREELSAAKQKAYDKWLETRRRIKEEEEKVNAVRTGYTLGVAAKFLVTNAQLERIRAQNMRAGDEVENEPVKVVSGNGAASTGQTVESFKVVSGNGTALTGRDSKNPWGTKKEKKEEQTGNGAAVEETQMAIDVVAPVVVEHAPVQVAPVNAAVKAVVNAGVIGMAAMLAAQGVVLGKGAVAAISAVVEANIKRDEPVVAAPVVVEPVEEETNTDASVDTETVDENAVANAAIRIQALWRGYMQRKKPVDAPVVVEPVVVVSKKEKTKSWADYSDSEDEDDSEDENDEKSVAALKQLNKKFADNEYVFKFLNLVIQHPLFDLVWGTFVDMWGQNEEKFKKLMKLDNAKMDTATRSKYFGINVAEWKGLGLTAAAIREMSSAVIEARGDVVGRIEAFLRVADEFRLLDKKFSYTAKGVEKTAAAFYAPIVLWNAVSTLPAPKKTDQRGFVARSCVQNNNKSTGAAAAAGTTTDSASAPVQPVNVLKDTLRGKWFVVNPGDQNKKTSAEQKAFQDTLNALDSAATGLSLDEVCAEYYLEGGSAQLKKAVNDFIGAKVNVVESGYQYTGDLIAHVMDEQGQVNAVLVASEEELVSMLNGVKEAMMKKMEQASA